MAKQPGVLKQAVQKPVLDITKKTVDLTKKAPAPKVGPRAPLA